MATPSLTLRQLGVDLDTQDDYIRVSTVYRTTAADSFSFRFVDGLCTTVIEVISVVAFYGAWGTGKWYFGARTEHEYLTLRNGGIALAQAHLVSLIIFVSQFVYLHNHFTCRRQCYVAECNNLFYSIILILSLFATSSYIRGWWEILDMLAVHTFPGLELSSPPPQTPGTRCWRTFSASSLGSWW